MGQPQRAFLAAGQAFAQNVDRAGAQRRPRAPRPGDRKLRGAGRDLRAASRPRPAAPDPDKAAWLRRAAELREHLAQSDEAIRDWQALLAEAPQDRQALDALGKLYEQTKNAKQLSDVTLRKAQLASDPARAPGAPPQGRRGAGGGRRTTPGPSTPTRRRWRCAGARTGSRRSTASTPGASASRSRPTCWPSSPPPPPARPRRRTSCRRAQLLEREKALPAAVEGYARLLAVARHRLRTPSPGWSG